MTSLHLPPSSRSQSRCSVFSTDSNCDLMEGSPDRHHSRSISLPFYLRSDSQVPESCQNVKTESHQDKNNLYRFCTGWKILLGSWMNILLIFIPVSWILAVVKPESYGLAFIFCILSLVPLVKIHDLSTRELAIRIGGSKTGLLNASMSNIVEIVVAISALRKCQLRVVQSSLIGSILSKLLLVLGMCFFAGGIRFSEQGFDVTATQIHSSLLSISVCAVVLPAAYHFSLGGDSTATSEWQKRNILKMSHGVSIVLLFIYASYLLFQLWSHTYLYKDNQKASNRHSFKLPKKAPVVFRRGTKSEHEYLAVDCVNGSQADSGRWTGQFQPIPLPSVCLMPSRHLYSVTESQDVSRLHLPSESQSIDVEKSSIPVGPTVRLVYGSDRTATTCEEIGISGHSNKDPGVGLSMQEGDCEYDSLQQNLAKPPEPHSQGHIEKTEVKHEPQLSLLLTLFSLVTVTIAVAITADRLVEVMDDISTTISKEWIGLILLPVINSVAECITAVNVSVHDQLTLSVNVTVGSTIQTALFVIPFMVTLAWTMDKPLALLFDPFESLVLYISVQTMSYVVADGKSNWLEGTILVCLYAIIAVSFWFYPGSNLPSSLAVCAVTP